MAPNFRNYHIWWSKEFHCFFDNCYNFRLLISQVKGLPASHFCFRYKSLYVHQLCKFCANICQQFQERGPKKYNLIKLVYFQQVIIVLFCDLPAYDWNKPVWSDFFALYLTEKASKFWMGYQTRHLYRPRRYELERKSFKLTLKTVILKNSYPNPERIATKAPRHKGKPLLNIHLCVLVSWWRKCLPQNALNSFLTT